MIVCGLLWFLLHILPGYGLKRTIRSDLDDVYGTITSPGFPSSSYGPNVNTRFIFDGKDNERVQLEFVVFELFYAEGNPANPADCEYADAVTITNPDNGDEIGRFCGSRVPPRLMSSSSRLELAFSSQYVQNSSPGKIHGFSARYRFVTDYGIKTGEQDSNGACVFRYYIEDAPNGTFTSPNYPGLYPQDTECSYYFYGSSESKVHIRFTNFRVDGVQPQCSHSTQSDYVELINLGVNFVPPYRMCGTDPTLHVVTSDRNTFRVTFKSNSIYDDIGFEAKYVITQSEDPFASDVIEEGTSDGSHEDGDWTTAEGAEEVCVEEALVTFRACTSRLRENGQLP